MKPETLASLKAKAIHFGIEYNVLFIGVRTIAFLLNENLTAKELSEKIYDAYIQLLLQKTKDDKQSTDEQKEMAARAYAGIKFIELQSKIPDFYISDAIKSFCEDEIVATYNSMVKQVSLTINDGILGKNHVN